MLRSSKLLHSLNTLIRKNSTSSRLPVLTLYTKDPCPLCDIAVEKILHLADKVNAVNILVN